MDKNNLFFYKAKVTNIYDGDTITCNIDCGFGVILRKQKIRLYGINTPEVRGEDKEKGIKIRDILSIFLYYIFGIHFIFMTND